MTPQSSWVVLVDWKNTEHMQSVLNFVKNYAQHRIVLYFSSLGRVLANKNFLHSSHLHQVCLYDKAENACSQVQRII